MTKQLWTLALIAAVGCQGGDEDRAPGDFTIPPAGVDGEPPVTALEGLLSCPTTELPRYTGTINASGETGSLSADYLQSCSACHGPVGEGGPGYPAINGDLGLADYIAAVRQGPGAMPSFDAAYISDDVLEADFEALQGLDGASVENGGLGAEWTWSDAQVRDALARGLVAWRMPDHEGVACADCHAPDAVDLAVIGYQDADILRRAALHLEPADAAAVVDYVHAQRRTFNLGKTCSTDWRPLQPGGVPLPGDTPAEQDTSFGRSLTERGLRIMTERVDDLSDAYAVFDEMTAIDLRELPIGIPLPRWTEDGFHGPDHASFNDHLMAVGRVPFDPDARHAEMDAYLADPTDDRLLEIVRTVGEATHDQGVAEATEDAWSQTNGRCGLVNRQHDGFLHFTDQAKREGLLLVQHFLRMELLDRPGWLDLPPAPFVEFAHEHNVGVNPFWRMGAQFAEHNCRNAGPMFASWPAEPAGEIHPSDLATGEAIELSRQVNHAWQVLGMLYDQTLLMQEDHTGNNNLHYWAIVGFDQEAVHHPFMYLHRILLQEHYYRDLRGTPEHPPEGINYHSSVQVHPILDGDRIQYKDLADRAYDADDARAPYANTLRCNAFRTLLLLQRELFAQNRPGEYILTGGNGITSLQTLWNRMEVFAQRLDTDRGALAPAYDGFEAMCTDDLAALVEEVRALGSSVADLQPAD